MEPIYTVTYTPVNSPVDISADVRRFSINRKMGSIIDSITETRCTLDFFNSAGIISNLSLAKRIKIIATYNSITYPMFSGIIQSISLDPRLGSQNASINAADDYDFAKRAEITTELLEVTNPSSLAATILSQVTQINSFSIDDTIVPSINFVWLSDEPATRSLQRLVEYSAGFFYIDGNGTAKLRNYQMPWRAEIADSFDEFLDLKVGYSVNNLANVARVQGRTRFFTVEERLLASLEEVITVPPKSDVAAGRVEFFLHYKDPVTEEDRPPSKELTAVSSRTPTSNTSLTVNLFATAAKVTAVNSSTSTMQIKLLEIRGRPALRTPEFTSVFEVTSSVSAFGKREHSLNNEWINDPAYARALAAFVLDPLGARLAEPDPTISVSLKNIFPFVLGDHFEEGITLVNTFVGLSDDNPLLIIGVSHEVRMDRGLEHTTTYELRPFIPLDEGIFILDESSLDGTDILLL